MWQAKKLVEISNEKAKEIFADILLMTLRGDLEWKLLTVAYSTKYNGDNLYIYRGEKNVGVMITSKSTEIFFQVSFEEFKEMYNLFEIKKLNSKNKRIGVQ